MHLERKKEAHSKEGNQESQRKWMMRMMWLFIKSETHFSSPIQAIQHTPMPEVFLTRLSLSLGVFFICRVTMAFSQAT